MSNNMQIRKEGGKWGGGKSKDMVAFLAEFVWKGENEAQKTNRNGMKEDNRRKETLVVVCA